MKAIYIISGITLLLAIAYIGFTSIVNRNSLSIAYKKDKLRCKLTAIYPEKYSEAVIGKINKWAEHGVRKTGHLPGALTLIFPDGDSWQVQAQRRNLNITACTPQHSPTTSFRQLKDNMKALSSFIVAEANQSQKRED